MAAVRSPNQTPRWFKFRYEPMAHLVLLERNDANSVYYLAACGKEFYPNRKLEDEPIIYRCYICDHITRADA